jgi:hypothetical protein
MWRIAFAQSAAAIAAKRLWSRRKKNKPALARQTDLLRGRPVLVWGDLFDSVPNAV